MQAASLHFLCQLQKKPDKSVEKIIIQISLKGLSGLINVIVFYASAAKFS